MLIKLFNRRIYDLFYDKSSAADSAADHTDMAIAGVLTPIDLEKQKFL
jgi:hypothetical protein